MAKRVAPLVVVVGETASGKSDLALRLAERHHGELICADSWTVRQQLNIGSAKPSLSDRQRITHHGLDIVDPDQDFTAAIFKRLAQQYVTDITGRGQLPIMVGGTGLYIDGLLYNYNFLPQGQPGQRTELNQLTHEQLQDKIQVAQLPLGDIDIRNKRRLIRLLETSGAVQTKAPLRPNTLIIGLQPERDQLLQRITQRVDTMLAAGLQQEVEQVAQKYGWDCEGLKGIGYREWRDYFKGAQSLEITRQRIISATVGLAKRQRTWFKRNKSIQWFTTPVDYAHIDELVTTFLNK